MIGGCISPLLRISNSFFLYRKQEWKITDSDLSLIGASLSEPHCYVANRGKRNALWCVRTRNFSTVIKIPSACDRNFYQFVVNLPIVFPSSQLLRQFAGFAFRKTLHISQHVICWQSWSNNNSKYAWTSSTNIYNLLRSNQMFSRELANLLLTIVAAIPL